MSDVYIGFMDEEVRPILSALQAKGWNVLVIERGNVDPNGVLFERPISAYEYPVMWKGWCGYSNESNDLISIPNTLNEDTLGDNRRTWLNVFQQCTYINMRDVFAKLPAGIMKTENGRTIKRKLGLVPSLSMLYMGAAKGRSGGLPTKILIRSPEMGLQPGLIRTQLRGILKALKSASNATKNDDEVKKANKINIWSYGAGGAYCKSEDGGGPGAIWNTKGSIYVGVERDKSAEGNRNLNGVSLYKGEIAYCSDEIKETLYTTPTFYTVNEARTNIEKVFEEKSNGNNLLFSQLNPIFPSIGLVTAPEKGGISITSNSFIGENLKSSAAKYGLKGGVNMEDYHLFKLIQSINAAQTLFTSVKNIENKYPILNDSKVIRIDADPAVIELSQENAKDYNQNKILITAYATILKWGLEGMIFSDEKIPDALNWRRKNDEVIPEAVTKYLVPYNSGKNKYINPYLLEAAQDLFREVGDWLAKVRTEKINTPAYAKAMMANPYNVGNLPIVANDQLTALVTQFEALDSALKKFCLKESESIAVASCETFLVALYQFIFDPNKEATLTKDSKVDIWARGGWGAKSTESYIVDHVNYSGSNIDRSFYKSTNSTVLSINAGTAVDTYFAAL